MRHKIITFILKNRPAEKKDKYKQKNDRAATAAENSGDEGGEMQTIDDDLEALPTAEEVQVDENDWAVDTSADAVQARLKDLAVSGAVSKLMGEDEDDLEDPIELFADYLTTNTDLSDEDIINKAEELCVRGDKAIAVLAQVLLDDKVLEQEEIASRTLLFQYFVKDEKSQKGLLGGIERLVCISHPSLLPLVSIIFKDLYFNDLVEEDVFLAWNDKISKKYVDKKFGKQIREHALPFMNWLREAEVESDE
jgi:translation initiation factor 5